MSRQSRVWYHHTTWWPVTTSTRCQGIVPRDVSDSENAGTASWRKHGKCQRGGMLPSMRLSGADQAMSALVCVFSFGCDGIQWRSRLYRLAEACKFNASTVIIAILQVNCLHFDSSSTDALGCIHLYFIGCWFGWFLPSGFVDGELGTHAELRTQRPAMPVGRQGWQLRGDVKLSDAVSTSCIFTSLIGFCIFGVTLKARALRNSCDCITCVYMAREATTPPWSYCSQATPTCFNREIWSKCADAHLVHAMCMLVCYKHL